MNDDARRAAFAGVVVVVAAVLAVLTLLGGGGGERPADVATPEGSPAPVPRPARPLAAERGRDGALRAADGELSADEARAGQNREPASEDEEEAKLGSSPREREALALSRRFLRHYGRYAVGRLTPAVERGLRATASGALVDALVAQPARAGEGAPRRPPRIVALEVHRYRRHGLLAAAQLRYGAGIGDTQIRFELEPRDGRLLVARLEP